MSPDTPIILITPEARATIEAEAERASASGDVTGGLLFGYPLDERRRLVVSSVRPRPEVNFGKKDFCLDQSRTSQQLKQAREMAPEAHYCGVWYVHRTPNQELTDEEWVQAQGVLEDPDYHFKDLVCLVICLYFGKLTTYASLFTIQQSVRGQMPSPAQLESASDSPTSATPSPRQEAPPPLAADWYQSPAAARRLTAERELLEKKYRVEPAVTREGRVIFRLMPKNEHQDMVFYMACEPGFPEKPPLAFLSIRGDRYPLQSPGLSEWSAEQRLVKIADDLVEWQARLLDQKVAAAKEALERGDYQEASDLLVMVLLVEPRKPRAARLLAHTQAMLGDE